MDNDDDNAAANEAYCSSDVGGFDTCVTGEAYEDGQ
jgi:hypothetical protein